MANYISPYDDLNGRGYVSHLISAIDIALWDIKGKVLNTPIYNLLGGAVRNRVLCILMFKIIILTKTKNY